MKRHIVIIAIKGTAHSYFQTVRFQKVVWLFVVKVCKELKITDGGSTELVC